MKRKMISVIMAICILPQVLATATESSNDVYSDYNIELMDSITLEECNSTFDGDSMNIASYQLSSSPTKIVSNTAVGDSPSENVFFVYNDEGNVTRSFVLLDKDEEGNFFVITEEEYGSHVFSDFTGEINKDTPDSDWYFDPENEQSIAYWLNDTLYENGAGGKKLPTSVKEHILKRSWYIENNIPNVLGSLKNLDEVKKWVGERDGVRSVTAKLALISYTEYQAYQDKISAEDDRVSDQTVGFMTRTAYSKAKNPRVTYDMNFLYICGSNNQETVSCNIDGVLNKEYYVRPVFLLDKDFFKSVKIDLANSGSNVIEEVKQNSYADLVSIYSNNELEMLGIDAEKLPVAKNVIVTGKKTSGSMIETIYEYESAEDVAEGNSRIEQYVSDTEDGSFELFKVCEKTDILSVDLEGKYVRFAVIPYDKEGTSGARCWSSAFYVGKANLPIVTECVTVNRENVNSIETNVKFFNTGKSGIVKIALVHFDCNNKIKSASWNEIDVASGESNHTETLELMECEENDRVVLMIKAEGKPIFYHNIK